MVFDMSAPQTLIEMGQHCNRIFLSNERMTNEFTYIIVMYIIVINIIVINIIVMTIKWIFSASKPRRALLCSVKISREILELFYMT